MKALKKCPTCDGEGMIKRDDLNELHHIDTEKVWCDEANEWMTLRVEICPECEGAGQVDIYDEIQNEIIDNYAKNRKQ